MSDAKQFIVGGIPVSVKDKVARDSIGDLSELTTTNKSNLVEAINEAAQSGSGEGSDPEAVKYTSQSLTTAQKNQARTNIGAGTYSKPSSGIPSSDLASGVIPDVSGKQDVIQDLSTIRSGAASGATAYQKPGTGIPASDLASGVIPTVPTISTDISADSASDTKTASPKAVKTYVDGVASAINKDIEDLSIAMETIGNGAFVVAWDGDSTPVVANIPAGVEVTYSATDYTGSLAASASTLGKIYLVATGTSGNYDRYVTVGDSTYSWVHIGTTSVALEEYATNSKVSQLETKVDESITQQLVEEEGFYLVDSNYNIGLQFKGGVLTVPTKYKGKRFSFLGDSITTFGVPDQNNATGTWTYPGNRCRYPQNDLFTDVKYCWWKRLIDKLGASLGINESWAGSRVSNTQATDSGDLGPNRCISSLTRIGHLDANGTPDVIIVYAGTNDIGNEVTVGSFDTTSPKDLTEQQIAALGVTTFADAFRAMLIRLQYYYRTSRIIVCLPNFTNTYYTMSELDNYIEVIREACDYFGVEYIDLRASGITIYNRNDYLPDGIHPNADGMELLFNKVYNYLMSN